MNLEINNIESALAKYLPKENLTSISYDTENKFSVVISEENWYNFDKSAPDELKKLSSTDTIKIVDNRIVFVEFKNEEIKGGTKLQSLRLKANESLLSLADLLKRSFPDTNMCDIYSIPKECYFVFNRIKTRPTKLLSFNSTHRILKKYYEDNLFVVFDFIDNDTFERKFLLRNT